MSSNQSIGSCGNASRGSNNSSSTSKSSTSAHSHRALKRRLDDLQRCHVENRCCCECSVPNPGWASLLKVSIQRQQQQQPQQQQQQQKQNSNSLLSSTSSQLQQHPIPQRQRSNSLSFTSNDDDVVSHDVTLISNSEEHDYVIEDFDYVDDYNKTKGGEQTVMEQHTVGVFICYVCSTAHKKLGAHFCQVKSVTVGSWNTEDVRAMERGGNKLVNSIFEANTTRTHSSSSGDNTKWNKPNQSSNMSDRIAFCQQKYQQRQFFSMALANELLRTQRQQQQKTSLEEFLPAQQQRQRQNEQRLSPQPPPPPPVSEDEEMVEGDDEYESSRSNRLHRIRHSSMPMWNSSSFVSPIPTQSRMGIGAGKKKMMFVKGGAGGGMAAVGAGRESFRRHSNDDALVVEWDPMSPSSISDFSLSMSTISTKSTLHDRNSSHRRRSLTGGYTIAPAAANTTNRRSSIGSIRSSFKSSAADIKRDTNPTMFHRNLSHGCFHVESDMDEEETSYHSDDDRDVQAPLNRQQKQQQQQQRDYPRFSRQLSAKSVLYSDTDSDDSNVKFQGGNNGRHKPRSASTLHISNHSKDRKLSTSPKPPSSSRRKSLSNGQGTGGASPRSLSSTLDSSNHSNVHGRRGKSKTGMRRRSNSRSPLDSSNHSASRTPRGSRRKSSSMDTSNHSTSKTPRVNSSRRKSLSNYGKSLDTSNHSTSRTPTSTSRRRSLASGSTSLDVSNHSATGRSRRRLSPKGGGSTLDTSNHSTGRTPRSNRSRRPSLSGGGTGLDASNHSTTKNTSRNNMKGSRRKATSLDSSNHSMNRKPRSNRRISLDASNHSTTKKSPKVHRRKNSSTGGTTSGGNGTVGAVAAGDSGRRPKSTSMDTSHHSKSKTPKASRRASVSGTSVDRSEVSYGGIMIGGGTSGTYWQNPQFEYNPHEDGETKEEWVKFDDEVDDDIHHEKSSTAAARKSKRSSSSRQRYRRSSMDNGSLFRQHGLISRTNRNGSSAHSRHDPQELKEHSFRGLESVRSSLGPMVRSPRFGEKREEHYFPDDALSDLSVSNRGHRTNNSGSSHGRRSNDMSIHLRRIRRQSMTGGGSVAAAASGGIGPNVATAAGGNSTDFMVYANRSSVDSVHTHSSSSKRLPTSLHMRVSLDGDESRTFVSTVTGESSVESSWSLAPERWKA